jgi:hypothetical protein
LNRFNKHLKPAGGAFIELAQTVLRRFIKAAQQCLRRFIEAAQKVRDALE